MNDFKDMVYKVELEHNSLLIMGGQFADDYIQNFPKFIDNGSDKRLLNVIMLCYL